MFQSLYVKVIMHYSGTYTKTALLCISTDHSDPCPEYALVAPPEGCRYKFEKDENGCDVPRLVCPGKGVRF